jgi:hypothetical protein
MFSDIRKQHLQLSRWLGMVSTSVRRSDDFQSQKVPALVATERVNHCSRGSRALRQGIASPTWRARTVAPPAKRSQLRLAHHACCDRRRVFVGDMGGHKRAFHFPSGVVHSLNSTTNASRRSDLFSASALLLLRIVLWIHVMDIHRAYTVNLDDGFFASPGEVIGLGWHDFEAAGG